MAHAAASHKHSATERARARSEATLYSAYQTKMFSRRYMHPSPCLAHNTHPANSHPPRLSHLDFDDLLLYASRLLHNNKEVLAQVAAGCKHLLVDEFQVRLQTPCACVW